MKARWLWLVLGFLSVGCGLAGTILPMVPTTPFLLLAAFAFARSSPRLHSWLLSHRYFGPLITNWRQHGSIDRKAKFSAIGVMVPMLGLTWYWGAAHWLLAAQATVLAVVAAWLLTRPDHHASGPDDGRVARSKRTST